MIEKIGVGGFGVVYRAEQSAPVRREVALKIVKPGMDTQQVLARFEAEKQALAMMDHAHIAKVHDAGSTEMGRPYFVMELVDGIPITKFCDRERLATRERLALFMEVCGAVQHAHQKGIIHRDLKPSNVLVTRHNGSPVPKVIDFGVAKATQEDLTGATIYTRQEQLIGTPAYMSPEQAEGGGQDLDTRSDIYALGVLLYELLTGATPFDSKRLATASPEEVRRVIREEDPPKPSTRVSGMGAEQRRELAERRKADPASLPRVLRGDLDWTVLKAMEKDRERRYETANGLAADLARHLADEPVTAGPPGASYRIGKYVRRHRAGLSVAAALALLLVAGSVISSWQAVRASRERAKAEQSERLMAYQLADEDPVRGRLELVRHLRESREDTLTAERLLSALWQRGSVRPLSPPWGLGAAAITRDGRYAVVGGENDNGTLRIVDAENGELVSSMVESGSPIVGVALSSDAEQRRITTNGLKLPELDGLVEVWEWKNEDGSIRAKPVRVGSFLHDDLQLFSELSPDGTMVLTGGQNRKYGRVWKIEPGETETRTVDQATLVGNPENHHTFSGCWSPDGTRVATAGTPARIWQIDEIRDGRVVGEPVTNRGQPHGKGIRSVRFSPDGERVVTGSFDATAQVWDARTGEPVGKRLIHADTVSYAEFSPDGGRVLTASFDRTVRLWDAEAGEPLLPAFQHPGGVEEAHFSPDGQLVMSDCEDNHFRIWSANTGELVEVRRGTMRDADGIMKTTAGRLADGGRKVLLWGGREGGAGRQVWPLLNSEARHQRFRHRDMTAWPDSGKVLSADFHPTEGILVSASRDQLIRLWRCDSGESLQSLRIRTEAEKRTVSFSPDGDRFLVTTSDWGFFVSDRTPSGWSVPRRFGERAADRGGRIQHAEFSPRAAAGDGSRRSRWIVSCNLAECRADVWDAESGVLKATLQLDREQGEWCNFASFSRDGSRVVTTGIDGSVQVWEGDWDRGENGVRKIAEFKQAETGSWQMMAFFHPTDRNRLLCASSSGEEATIWRIDPVTNQAEVVHRFKHDRGVPYAEWSPDGARVLTASDDVSAQVWDAVSGDKVGEALRHGDSVVRAEFSPDGRRVVTACQDGTARVWDAETGFPLSEWLEHHSPVNFARFSPDGRQVVTTGDDATVRLWDVPPAPPSPAPVWLPGFVEAISGMRIEDDGSVTKIGWEERREVREEIEAIEPDDYYVRVAQWYYQDTETRPITPFSEVTISQYVANRIRENTEVSLKEALQAAPGNAEALLALAGLTAGAPMQNVDNLRLASHHAKAALRAGSEDAAEVVATIARKLRLVQVNEGLNTLAEQAKDCLEAGQVAEGTSLLATAALGFVLVSTEFDERPLSQLPVPADGTLWEWAGLLRPPVELVPAGAEWRVAPPGARFSTDWARTEFVDATWPGGPAPIGFSRDGEDGEETRIEPDDQLTTYYFRHAFEVSESELQSVGGHKLALRIRCDDGAVIYLNGEEALRVNMPEGAIGPDTPAAKHATDGAWSAFEIDADSLAAGENLLAVEVHQKHGDKKPSSDLMLDLELALVPAVGELLWSMVEEDRAAIVSALRFSLPKLATPERQQRWDAALAEHISPEATAEDLEFRVRVQVALEQWTAAVEALDLVIASVHDSYEPAQVRRSRELLRTKVRLLELAGKMVEARAAQAKVAAIPPRDPRLDERMIDLQKHYSASFFAAKEPAPDSEGYWLGRLAEHYEAGDGPEFDIRGKIQLNSGRYPDDLEGKIAGKDLNEQAGLNRPMKIEGIAIDQRAAKLHFLQSCHWGREEPGVEVASYTVHYEDGSSERIPVIYGKDMADFSSHARPKEVEDGLVHIAWEQDFQAGKRRGTLALTRQTWVNPHPEKQITHLDFESAGRKAAPFLVGITVE